MVKVIVPDFREVVLKKQWQDFEEKIIHIKACLSHSSAQAQAFNILIDDKEIEEGIAFELDEETSKTRALIYTGQDDIRDLEEIYRELKEGQYQCQEEGVNFWPFCDRPSPRWIALVHRLNLKSFWVGYQNLEDEEAEAELPDLKDLLQKFEKQMLQTYVCLFRSHSHMEKLVKLVQGQVDQDLTEKIIETRVFVRVSYRGIEQLKGMYQNLKEESFNLRK